MRQALALIGEWTPRLEAHRFFHRLAGKEPDLRRAMSFAPAGTFWVMTFQDILRLNTELARDPAVAQILLQHRDEDSGHEQWFLEDLRTVFGDEITSIRWLFSDENRKVRDMSFALTAEVFRIEDDRLRMVFVEVLESAAGIFFGHISRFLQRSGHASRLKYLAGVHLDAEAGHEMHGDEHRRQLEEMVLAPELRVEAARMIERMFASFLRLADALAERMDAPA